LRTRHIKILGDIKHSGVSIERMAEEFHTLCEEAAQVGAYVSLEVLPGANIGNLAVGRRFLELARAPNGGLLIDIWHMTRAGVPFTEIASLPLDYIKHVELNDAAAEQIGNIFEDTMNNRLLPGQGSFDIPGFLRAVESTGYAGPYGVEIFSNAFRQMEPEEASRRSFEATMSQIAKARRTAPDR
jgi:sugar phosphate isomerase/epimerase